MVVVVLLLVVSMATIPFVERDGSGRSLGVCIRDYWSRWGVTTHLLTTLVTSGIIQVVQHVRP